MTETTGKIVLNKEEKLAKIDKEIARLNQRRYNIENDIVEVKAKKEVVLPAIGTDVLFRTGRTTTSTTPVERIGTVVAIKPATVTEAGKKTPAQIKVSVGQGFDQEFIVIYPAQIVDAGPATA